VLGALDELIEVALQGYDSSNPGIYDLRRDANPLEDYLTIIFINPCPNVASVLERAPVSVCDVVAKSACCVEPLYYHLKLRGVAWTGALHKAGEELSKQLDPSIQRHALDHDVARMMLSIGDALGKANIERMLQGTKPNEEEADAVCVFGLDLLDVLAKHMVELLGEPIATDLH